jgi:hypothetical protein
MADLPAAGEAGVLPYVFVEQLDETLEKVVAQGGGRDAAVSGRRSASCDVPRPGGERDRRLATRVIVLTAFAVRALPRRPTLQA